MSNYEFCKKCFINEDAIKECLMDLVVMRKSKKIKWSIVNKVHAKLLATRVDPK